jgi:hypothetical protein
MAPQGKRPHESLHTLVYYLLLESELILRLLIKTNRIWQNKKITVSPLVS